MKKIFTFIMIVTAFAAYGQQVGLDPTFGEEGILKMPFILENMVIDHNDHIICLGCERTSIYDTKSALIKYNPNGILDDSFGEEGTFFLPFNQYPICNSLKIQSDNKIMFGTYISDSVSSILMRFHSNGILDETFAEHGIMKFNHYKTFDVYFLDGLMLLLDDHSLLLYGELGALSQFYGHCIIKFDPTGKIDESFGDEGAIIIQKNIGNFIADFILSEDENLLCAGRYQYVESLCFKMDQQGNYITDFGANGRIIMKLDMNPIDWDSEGFKYIKQLNAHEVFIAGYKKAASELNVFFKIDPITGAVKNSFGEDGFLFTDDGYRFVDVQADGKILLGKSEDNIITIVRLTPDGDFDMEFNREGFADFQFSQDVYLYHMAIQGGNKLVFGGRMVGEDFLCRIDLGEVNAIGDDPANARDVILYPNPTSGKLEVRSEELGVKKIEIFDIFGRQVLETNETIFSISQLPIGIYLARIETEKGVVTEKIVKQ